MLPILAMRSATAVEPTTSVHSAARASADATAHASVTSMVGPDCMVMETASDRDRPPSIEVMISAADNDGCPPHHQR